MTLLRVLGGRAVVLAASLALTGGCSANDDGTVGGMARLAAKVAADRAAAGEAPVLLLDSGDFLMGSPFQILATGGSAELLEMNKLKYDATIIGNHELDWGPKALAAI